VVIAGRPNVGKSSLFNVLAGADRAIVTDVPGTTRDLVTERVDIEGLAVTLVDTAGVRDTLDVAEREGVARGDRARNVADLVLVVVDATVPLSDADSQLLAGAPGRRVVVVNKIDLAPDAARCAEELGRRLACDVLAVSAATTAGIDALRLAVARALTGREVERESATISNTRHVALLERARVHLDAAGRAAGEQSPEEFLLSDLQTARQAFDEIVGRRTTDDLLAHIFERFCVGK